MAVTQADILALFERILPEWYLDGLKSPGPGYEVLQAYAKLFARVSEAIENDLDNGAFILQAMAGSKATGVVQFTRPTATAGAVTVQAGTLVKTSKGGRVFILTADAIFGALDVGPIDAPVEAVAMGWEWNVSGMFISPRGETVPGEIDTISFPLLNPPFGDQTIVVSQADPTTGGAGAMLDQLGLDRGVPRSSPTELDVNYRYRIRTLPDVVTPDAIIRQINNYLRTYVPSYDGANSFIETWDIRYQTCWIDAPVAEGGAPSEQPNTFGTSGGYDPNLFTYDDPRSSPPFNDRWLDDDEARGTFIVVVPDLSAEPNYALILGRLYDLIQNIKAGGILAILELAGE